MKVGVALLLVCVAVFARAQDLQYESATYSDATAPAPFEEQPMNAVAEEAVAEEESSPEMTLDVAEQDPAFAETDASSEPGALSRAAHRVGQQIRRVKKLFHKRKHAGGNISPSRRVAAPPKPHHKKHHKKPVAAARAAALKAKVLKKPIIAAPKAPAKAKAAAKKAKKAAKKAAHKAAIAAKKAKLLAKKKKHSRRIPRAPAAARGPVDNLFHEERLEQKGENRDPEMAKLNLALNAVKEDILSTNKQINDERRWVIAVSKIINSYNNKMKRVEGHIIALRKEMKALYRKKKQIENLKLQRALEAKLKEAKAELLTLRNSLKHVAVKQGELNKSGRDLRATIRGIQGQLLKLRGKSKKCPRGSRLSLKSKKCVSVCKKGTRFSRHAGKCVRRCKKGTRFSRKHKKCVRAKKGRSARRSRKAGRKHGKHGRKHAPRRK